MGDTAGEKVSVPLCVGTWVPRGHLTVGQKVSPLICSSPSALANCTWARIFSNVLSLQVHREISKQFLIPLPQLAFSGSNGSFFKPAWPDAETASLCRQAIVCSRSRTCALECTGFAVPWADPFSSPPGGTFVADSIWFQRASRRGGGAAWRGPPVSHVRSDLRASRPRREREPSPEQAAPVSPHCLRDRASFPSWPACEWRDVKS